LDKKTSLNGLLEYDPFPGKKKVLTLYYTLNEELFKEEYFENEREDIFFDLKNASYGYQFAWINSINPGLFEDIIRHLSFHRVFQEMANEFLGKINKKSNRRNVVHLRIENDSIQHYSKMCKMTEAEFLKIAEEKYISLIQKHFSREEEIILLSYSTQNGVIDFLKKNKYSYHFIEKDRSKGREWNAILDLHIALACNNTFIGGWNPQKLNGSTFSYIISQKLSKEVKKVMLDLDFIQNDEIIYH